MYIIYVDVSFTLAYKYNTNYNIVLFLLKGVHFYSAILPLVKYFILITTQNRLIIYKFTCKNIIISGGKIKH